MKKIAIMQPYFLPYIGYFQLINAVDEFVIYDNVQFSKRGWFHRNRILENGNDVFISLPLKKDSDYLNVADRCLAENFELSRVKILAKVKNNYRRAPFFDHIFPLLEDIFNYDNINLFHFTNNSISIISDYLSIHTPKIISSTINIDHNLRGKEKVKAIVKERNADVYINPIGGTQLYNTSDFKKDGIELKFLKTSNYVYPQFDNNFIPFLSILDVLMFNEIAEIQDVIINKFTYE